MMKTTKPTISEAQKPLSEIAHILGGSLVIDEESSKYRLFESIKFSSGMEIYFQSSRDGLKYNVSISYRTGKINLFDWVNRADKFNDINISYSKSPTQIARDIKYRLLTDSNIQIWETALGEHAKSEEQKRTEELNLESIELAIVDTNPDYRVSIYNKKVNCYSSTPDNKASATIDIYKDIYRAELNGLSKDKLIEVLRVVSIIK